MSHVRMTRGNAPKTHLLSSFNKPKAAAPLEARVDILPTTSSRTRTRVSPDINTAPLSSDDDNDSSSLSDAGSFPDLELTEDGKIIDHLDPGSSNTTSKEYVRRGTEGTGSKDVSQKTVTQSRPSRPTTDLEIGGSHLEDEFGFVSSSQRSNRSKHTVGYGRNNAHVVTAFMTRTVEVSQSKASAPGQSGARKGGRGSRTFRNPPELRQDSPSPRKKSKFTDPTSKFRASPTPPASSQSAFIVPTGSLSDSENDDPLSLTKWRRPRGSNETSTVQSSDTLTRSSTSTLPTSSSVPMHDLSLAHSNSSNSSLSSCPPSPILNALSKIPSSLHLPPLSSSSSSALPTCPLCRSPLTSTYLKAHPLPPTSQLTAYRAQSRVCLSHRRHAAHALYSTNKYPTVDWLSLPARIKTTYPALTSILHRRTPSTFLSTIESSIDAGTLRSLKQTLLSDSKEDRDQVLAYTPGYYGQRGGRLMMEMILEDLGPTLRSVAGTDEGSVFGGVGVTGWVMGVGVGECAIRLVAEDRSLDVASEMGFEEARRMIRESAAVVGELINGDMEDE